MKVSPWIVFVSRRWFASRKESGGGLSSVFAAAGIAVGVAALVVVLGVMNGFQLGFIDSILDVSSFHLRIEAESPPSGGERGFDERLAAAIASAPGVLSVIPFAETRCLLAGPNGRAYPVVVRALPPDAARRDSVMMRALKLGDGAFPPDGGGLVIGAEISRYLGIPVGSRARLTIVTAGGEEGAEAKELRIPIAGTFRSGYYDFDSGMALIAADEIGELFPTDRPLLVTYGVKLKDRYADAAAAESIRSMPELAGAEVQAWRDYNRAFFGALRTEKIVMMLLIGLIFLVVGVNIFHSMRRAVAERSEDIAVLKAVGASAESVRLAFIIDGMAVGALGAAAGLAVGLLIAINVNEILALAESVGRMLSELVLSLFGSGTEGDFRVFSPQYFYLSEVPVRVLFPETLFVVTAAVGSSAAAASAAAAKAADLAPAEVLRYE